jgi:predicted TPR repeat methyltransferase
MNVSHKLLQQALALHQQGDLPRARTLYEQVLAAEPRNFDALHLSGVLARQGGDTQKALDLIGKAIAVDPTRAIAHCNLGVALQDSRRFSDALDSFDLALALQPRYTLALSNRGNALRNLGRLDEALASYNEALDVQPDYAEALCNRGAALQELGRHEEALDSFGPALSVRRDYPEALHGAASSLLALGAVSDALEGFERAIKLRPDYAEAWCARGSLLLRAQDLNGALASFQEALDIRPDYARAQLGIANTLRALGRAGHAIAAYEKSLALGADPELVGYMLAALGAQQAPSASPAAYVQGLFDQYAGRFDHHLVEVLQYRTPALLADAVRRSALQTVAAEPVLDVLDLGCGTGLCGALLRPMARTLEGVDLSPRMLERARELGIYDALHCAEMTGFLLARPLSADLIVAADVFVYAGDLAAVFAAARAALRPAGQLAFSVEVLHAGGSPDAGSFALRSSGRYAHSEAYLRGLAAAHGFAVSALEPCVLRKEDGADIAGLLAVMSV